MTESSDGWRQLIHDYEAARAREDSLDRLIEWDAQKALIGPVDGRRVLDVGCGNGEKAIELARAGAAQVAGLDIAGAFVSIPPGLPVRFAQGDLSDLANSPLVDGQRYDVIVFLQSLGFAADQEQVLRAARAAISEDGVLVVSRAHPIRFAVERAEQQGIGLGSAYHQQEPVSYRSGWNDAVTVSHATNTFSAMVNTIVAAGFWVEQVAEPQLSDQQKARYPRRQAWLDHYLGTVMFRARPRG